MPNDDLQDSKNLLSAITEPLNSFLTHKHRISPAPSQGIQGNSSKIRMPNLPRFRSKKNRVIEPHSDHSTVIKPDGLLLHDQRAALELSGESQAEVTVATVQDNLLPSHGIVPNALTGQSPGLPDSVRAEGNSQSTEPNAGSSIKEHLLLTGRVLQTLIKKAPNFVDPNPAKLALNFANLVIDVKNAVKGNKDAVARQIAMAGGQMEEVAKALDSWNPDNKEGYPWIDNFKITLEEEFRGLEALRNESNFRKFLDHEDEQGRIKDIFTRINEARVRFELAMGIRVFKAVYGVDRSVKELFLDRLKPSDIAHHDYILEGEEGRLLRRQVCTPGTRVRILNDIITWAKDTSSDTPNVYWLFGHAGSGKSTIAYTIARRFEYTGDSNDAIILGGNFFCSRQFDQTRLSKYIIRTIVYHLSLKCKPFADALIRSGRLDTITQSVSTQLDGLLFGPWEESEGARHENALTPLHYLIVIDALDEIEGTSGSIFLHNLVNAINNRSRESLHGLKFFVTSRSDNDLVGYMHSLKQKQVYRLQDVKEEEGHHDVALYLKTSLPGIANTPEMDQLVNLAAGLFIYAATVVRYVEGYLSEEHLEHLSTLFYETDTGNLEETLLDQLYHQLLSEAQTR